jgi:hypothetical protein
MEALDLVSRHFWTNFRDPEMARLRRTISDLRQKLNSYKKKNQILRQDLLAAELLLVCQYLRATSGREERTTMPQRDDQDAHSEEAAQAGEVGEREEGGQWNDRGM